MRLDEWLEAGVAAGTGTLALVTGWLAKGASDQVDATVRLALAAEEQADAFRDQVSATERLASGIAAQTEASERHFLASGTPRLDIFPDVQWSQQGSLQTFAIRVRNSGDLAATLTAVTLSASTGETAECGIPDATIPGHDHVHVSAAIQGHARPASIVVRIQAHGRDRDAAIDEEYVLRQNNEVYLR